MPKTCIEQPDSLSTNIVGESSKDSFPFLVFGIPIALVFLVTWLKYNTRQRLTSREFGLLLLDLCVDILTVGSTILVAYYNLVTKPFDLFWNCISLIFAMLMGIFIRSRYVNGEISSNRYRLLWVFLSCVVCISVMSYLYYNVC